MAMWALITLAVAAISTTHARYAYTPLQWCCYGDRAVMESEVALTVASCCLQLVCEGGKLVERHVGQPGGSACCLGLDGFLHPSGYLTNDCFPMKCVDGQWVPAGSINGCCSKCSFYVNGNYVTFDGHHYAWNGKCNMTLTQEGTTHNPDFGISLHREDCTTCGSCLAQSHFRNSPSEVVKVTRIDLFTLQVNGETFHVPVSGVHRVKSSYAYHDIFAWRQGECLVLMGSSQVAAKYCFGRIDIWVNPSLSGSLYGMCGHLNSYIKDDFTDRAGVIHPLVRNPNAFSLSWRTDVQCDQCTRGQSPGTNVYYSQKGVSHGGQCNAPPLVQSQYHKTCKDLLLPVLQHHSHLYFYIDTCASSLCLLLQGGGGLDSANSFLIAIINVVKIHIEDNQRTLGNQADQSLCLPTTISTDLPPTTTPYTTTPYNPYTTTSYTTPYVTYTSNPTYTTSYSPVESFYPVEYRPRANTGDSTEGTVNPQFGSVFTNSSISQKITSVSLTATQTAS